MGLMSAERKIRSSKITKSGNEIIVDRVDAHGDVEPRTSAELSPNISILNEDLGFTLQNAILCLIIDSLNLHPVEWMKSDWREDSSSASLLLT
ncbi:hypothetical protein TNIN_81041 [Trichonephila inaurata madagascariensis]|uniref:Uncharacterized protein n=1 Tax=Trichonephila inaurata madagascariensis TaxID=2747483 RepID=A0A8X7BXQ8_9ARAC|nr:hypothetical protein TNIN_81041 [Trichonephila inaurata madagascariensis]